MSICIPRIQYIYKIEIVSELSPIYIPYIHDTEQNDLFLALFQYYIFPFDLGSKRTYVPH